MAGNWSIKQLHKFILLSSAYSRPVTTIRRAKGSIQPTNNLCWRMNRRRLDFEAMRDTLLAASGKLDLTAVGPR